MNKCIFLGRLTKDPELKQTQNDKVVASFSVAVRRNYKNANGEYEADFINCVSFGKTAEFVSKYFAKGNQIAISGRLQARSWDDENGKKRYGYDVVVEDADFVESKKDGAATSAQPVQTFTPSTGFEAVPANDEDLPF